MKKHEQELRNKMTKNFENVSQISEKVHNLTSLEEKSKKCQEIRNNVDELLSSTKTTTLSKETRKKLDQIMKNIPKIDYKREKSKIDQLNFLNSKLLEFKDSFKLKNIQDYNQNDIYIPFNFKYSCNIYLNCMKVKWLNF